MGSVHHPFVGCLQSISNRHKCPNFYIKTRPKEVHAAQITQCNWAILAVKSARWRRDCCKWCMINVSSLLIGFVGECLVRFESLNSRAESWMLHACWKMKFAYFSNQAVYPEVSCASISSLLCKYHAWCDIGIIATRQLTFPRPKTSPQRTGWYFRRAVLQS